MSELTQEFIQAEIERIKWRDIPDEIVVFDVETTGLEPKKDRVLEIGAALFTKSDYSESGEITTFQCFIKQSEPIPAEITKINGITDEMVADGIGEYEALEKFFEFVGERDVYAYNAKFDKDFLNAMSRRSGYSKEPVIEDAIDIYKFIRDSWEIKPNYKLTTVAKHLKIEIDGAHRAVKDSVMALQCYVQIQQKLTCTEHITHLKSMDSIMKRIQTSTAEIEAKTAALDAEIEARKKEDSSGKGWYVGLAFFLIGLLILILKQGKH